MGRVTGVGDVISFGERAAKIKAQKAREAMNVDFTRAIPGAELYARYIDPEILSDATIPHPDYVVATAPSDTMSNIMKQMGELDDDQKMGVAELAREFRDSNADAYTTLDDLPTFPLEWDDKSGDFTLYVTKDALTDIEAMRIAALQTDGRSGNVPMQFEWTGDRPWDISQDWRHSGMVKVVDEETGKVVTRLRTDEFGIPFDEDFVARRDKDFYKNWWTQNPMKAWAANSQATSRQQVTSAQEAKEFLGTMFGPDARAWNNVVNHDGEALGQTLNDYAIMNGINMPDKYSKLLEQGHIPTIEDFLQGRWEPRIDWKEAVQGHKEAADIANGTNRARMQASRASAREVGDVPADEWDVNKYFDNVFNTMQKEDPERYRQMMEFVGESPYRLSISGDSGLQNPDAPMLLFHSNKYRDTAKSGIEEMEAPQFASAPREVGLHAGELPQASGFGGYEMLTFDDSVSGRVDYYHSKILDDVKYRMDTLFAKYLAPPFRDALESSLARTLNRKGDMLVPHRNQVEGALMEAPIYKDVLNDLIPGWGDEIDRAFNDRFTPSMKITDEMQEKFGVLFQSELNEETMQRAGIEIANMLSSMQKISGKFTFPLVFRGKRPFRLRDVSSNTPAHWAVEALKWPGFQRNEGWKARLEAIAQSKPRDIKAATEDFRAVLEEAGFDHIIYVNQTERAGRPSVVFWDQSLAKPLYGSRGFDKNSASWVKGVMAAPGFSLITEEKNE